jgi:TPR repeat protein
MEHDERDECSLTACAASPSRRDAGDFLELGMNCMLGRSAPVDLVSAHKWFNVAAMLGSAEASRLRREIATEMSNAEITSAQRAARAWMTLH